MRSRSWVVVLSVIALGVCAFSVARVRAVRRVGMSSARISEPELHKVTPDMLETAGRRVRTAAPPFRLADAQGITRDLAELRRSGPVVLIFIKDGCPCSASAAPYFNELHDRYKGGLRLLGVIDGDAEVARRWGTANGVVFPILPDPRLHIAEAYGATNSAFVALIDPEGDVEELWPGYSATMLQDLNRRASAMARLPMEPGHGRSPRRTLFGMSLPPFVPFALSNSPQGRLRCSRVEWESTRVAEPPPGRMRACTIEFRASGIYGSFGVAGRSGFVYRRSGARSGRCRGCFPGKTFFPYARERHDLGSVRRKPSRRSYLPKVEALEALRLLDAAPAALGLIVPPPASLVAPNPVPAGPNHDTWDAALQQTQLVDLLASPRTAIADDPALVASGLSQLDRYLGRCWSRAGIAPQAYDDCTQAVYTSLLQAWGRGPFDELLAEVGDTGIRVALSRDTPEGPEFFRAIDTVKKRSQREKTFTSLDAGTDVANADGASSSWRSALEEAIARNLSPREANLEKLTLQARPRRIALQWGVALEDRATRRRADPEVLREVLVAELADWKRRGAGSGVKSLVGSTIPPGRRRARRRRGTPGGSSCMSNVSKIAAPPSTEKLSVDSAPSNTTQCPYSSGTSRHGHPAWVSDRKYSATGHRGPSSSIAK